MKNPLKIKEITLQESIPYNYLTKIYGRAGFVICPIFKRSILTDLYIYRVYQPQEPNKAYHIPVPKEYKLNCFTIDSEYGYDNPNIWQNFWCKEHRTISFKIYVPNNTKFLEFSTFSDHIQIQFRGTSYRKNVSE